MKHETYSAKETEQRLQRILRGAFVGSPTPLKDIPKRNGESRVDRPINAKARKKTRKSRAK